MKSLGIKPVILVLLVACLRFMITSLRIFRVQNPGEHIGSSKQEVKAEAHIIWIGRSVDVLPQCYVIVSFALKPRVLKRILRHWPLYLLHVNIYSLYSILDRTGSKDKRGLPSIGATVGVCVSVFVKVDLWWSQGTFLWTLQGWLTDSAPCSTFTNNVCLLVSTKSERPREETVERERK